MIPWLFLIHGQLWDSSMSHRTSHETIHETSHEAIHEAIHEAAQVLQGGGIVCVPTESSYGLAADVRCHAACQRLAVIKSRDLSSPFPTIAASLEQARTLAAPWPLRANELAAKHWPGPLTLVVPARSGLPESLVGASLEVGVRVSANEWARLLAALLGGPYTATSANRRGQPAALSSREAHAIFTDQVDFYIDGRRASNSRPSTVARVTSDGDIQIIRTGPIELKQDLSPINHPISTIQNKSGG